MPIKRDKALVVPPKPAEDGKSYPDDWVERIEITYRKNAEGLTQSAQAVFWVRAHNADTNEFYYPEGKPEQAGLEQISIPDLEAALADTNFPEIGAAFAPLLAGIAAANARKKAQADTQPDQ